MTSEDLEIVLVGVHRRDRWELQEADLRRQAVDRLLEQVAARGLELVGRPVQRVEVLFGAGRTRLVVQGRARTVEG
jgi:hypothetical protein